ncbi:MAG: glycosyltransferase family 39 protein [bacterium]|nr:glycosyltransferase family 39 protein [bacterium]
MSKPHTPFITFIHICLCLCALGIAVFQIQHYARFTVDDAFISFRYAENFANGGGLVFNKGEYVEGYTNFLWVILLGSFHKLGFDIPHMSLILGAVFSLLTLLGGYFLSCAVSRKRTFPPSASLLMTFSIIALASSRSFGIWAVAGLETPLFMCLLTWAIYRRLREEEQSGFPFSAILFGLMALTRPEGIMYFGLSCLHSCVYRLKSARGNAFEQWKNVLIFSAFVVPHFLWRWLYYGYLFPNTSYIKVGGELKLSGFKYVYEFFLHYGGGAFFLICCLLVLATRLNEYWSSYLLSIMSLSILYFLYVGGDWMPEFRFFAPLLPLFFLLMQEGLREFPGRVFKKHLQLATAGVGLIMLVIAGNNLLRIALHPPFDSRHDGHVQIGHFLKEYAEPGDVLAAIDIGAMAYISGLRTIDYFGLADAHIAHLQPVEHHFDPGFWGRTSFRLKSDIDYVMAQKPRFIELNSANNPQNTQSTIPLDPYSALMFRNPDFQTQYVPLYHSGGTTLFRREDASN